MRDGRAGRLVLRPARHCAGACGTHQGYASVRVASGNLGLVPSRPGVASRPLGGQMLLHELRWRQGDSGDRSDCPAIELFRSHPEAFPHLKLKARRDPMMNWWSQHVGQHVGRSVAPPPRATTRDSSGQVPARAKAGATLPGIRTCRALQCCLQVCVAQLSVGPTLTLICRCLGGCRWSA
jgi:hypothetical protein